VRSAAVAAGHTEWLLVVLGPTLLALVDAAHCTAIEVAMREAWNKENYSKARSLIDLPSQDLRR